MRWTVHNLSRIGVRPSGTHSCDWHRIPGRAYRSPIGTEIGFPSEEDGLTELRATGLRGTRSPSTATAADVAGDPTRRDAERGGHPGPGVPHADPCGEPNAAIRPFERVFGGRTGPPMRGDDGLRVIVELPGHGRLDLRLAHPEPPGELRLSERRPVQRGGGLRQRHLHFLGWGHPLRLPRSTAANLRRERDGGESHPLDRSRMNPWNPERTLGTRRLRPRTPVGAPTTDRRTRIRSPGPVGPNF